MTHTIGSFDIGVKSFAQSILTVDTTLFNALIERQEVPSLESLYRCCRRVHTVVLDLRADPEDASKYTPEARQALLTHLHDMEPYWATCDLILIEQQMSAIGKYQSRINFHAIRISETLHTWFMMRDQGRPGQTPLPVLDVPSGWKTQYLGAPKRLTYEQRKKWSVENMKVIVRAQEDTEMLTLFELQTLMRHRRQQTPEAVHTLLREHGLDPTSSVYSLAYRMIHDRQKLDDVADTYNQVMGYLMHALQSDQVLLQ